MTNFTANEIIIIDRFNAYKAWAKEAVIDYHLDSYDRETVRRYPDKAEKILCRNSERYTSLVKIEAIIAEPGFDAKLHAYGEDMRAKWYYFADKLTEEIDKSSCHWRREGFDSRNDYREYLWDDYLYVTKYGYKMSVMENLISDLYNEVLDEAYDLYY